MSERSWPSLSFRPHSTSHSESPTTPAQRSRTSWDLEVPACLSMSQMTTCRWSFLEDVQRYRQAGFSALAAWRPKLVDFGEERSAELLQDSGLRVSSLNWAGGFTGANGYSFNEAVHDVRETIRTASRLGAPVVTIVSGAKLGHIQPHATRLLVEGLTATVDIAAEWGVTLALQPMHSLFRDEWTFLNSLDLTEEILAQIDHPHLGIAFGTYHLWQEPDLLARLPALVPRIAVVQISDWRDNPRCDNDRLPPGSGSIPLAPIVGTLEEHGYAGDYEVDVWSTDLWKTDERLLLRRACGDVVTLLEPAIRRPSRQNRTVRS